jgi:N-acyl amino acid synthase of PEP-CTERM/exosortase system
MSQIVAPRLTTERAARTPDPHFTYICVDGTSDLELTYRIRYQVYCEEQGLLPKTAYPAGLEVDEFDQASMHILARHRTGEPAGTVRLVMSSPIGFPMMRYCVLSGDYAALNDPGHPALASFAEVSRLAIAKSFRRRVGDNLYGGPPRLEDVSDARTFAVAPFRKLGGSEILIGICRSLYQESKRRGITHWMLAMERSLYVMLHRLGFKYTPAGPEVDYYGAVRPYLASIDALEKGLYDAFPATLEYMIEGLEPELAPACMQRPELMCRSDETACSVGRLSLGRWQGDIHD